jgi:hypothetical protein
MSVCPLFTTQHTYHSKSLQSGKVKQRRDSPARRMPGEYDLGGWRPLQMLLDAPKDEREKCLSRIQETRMCIQG